jgi:hypothetical protein
MTGWLRSCGRCGRNVSGWQALCRPKVQADWGGDMAPRTKVNDIPFGEQVKSIDGQLGLKSLHAALLTSIFTFPSVCFLLHRDHSSSL